MKPKKRHAGLPSLSVSPPRIPSLHITSRAALERSELPKDGPTPGLDAPFTLSLTAGKGEPEKPRKTLFRDPRRG